MRNFWFSYGKVFTTAIGLVVVIGSFLIQLLIPMNSTALKINLIVGTLILNVAVITVAYFLVDRSFRKKQ